jgi:gamma-glutamyltranspeptidase/glutathione hydrolase
VIEPQSTGIGGDCFCLYAPAGTGKVIGLNGSGRAPRAASIDWFEFHQIRAIDNTSAHAVSVPGAIDAWETLLNAHGTKGLDELLQPAIRMAAEGWPVHSKVSRDWVASEGKLRKNGSDPFLPGGSAPKPGDMFVNAPLAETLRAIAKHGAKAFYTGAVAADIVATLRAKGGLHTEEDFAAGLGGANFVEPITIDWNGHTVHQIPPNGQGILVLMMLGMLERLGDAPDGPDGLIRAHRHIEAARLAYRDRDAFVADPTMADVPVRKLLSDAYLSAQAGLIRDGGAMADLPNAGESILPPHKDTIYLCVVDKDGNACSFINSLFESFGSGILAQGSGVMLQNRGFGFRVQRGHPNCIAPGKRPMHTIIPGMVTRNGEAVMPYGVMGGHYQPMGQFPALRAGYPRGDRSAPPVPHGRQGAGRARDFGVRRRRPPPPRPRRGAHGSAAWRWAGDLHRPRPRRAGRGVRAAQGRAGAGVLTAEAPPVTPTIRSRRIRP